MADQHLSLALTTYQAGKLFFIGLDHNQHLAVFERSFQRCMGLWSNGQTMWMASLYQLWRFENALPPGEKADDKFDRLFVPQVGYTTGGLDVHDVAADRDQRPIFVNTRYSCLATVSETTSFAPLWQPPFISTLLPHDRCHLNGLAIRDGRPRYVTAAAQTDREEAWREHRADGGCIIDIHTNQTIATGLSMPHSPRWHDDQLWFLNSGTGHLCRIEPHTHKPQSLAFCPGYARGLALHDHFAVVGLSLGREQRAFGGLPLEHNLKTLNAQPRCGLMIVDTNTGRIRHWLKIEGPVKEIYDVIILPDVERPMALGFQYNEIHQTITIDHAPHRSNHPPRRSTN